MHPRHAGTVRTRVGGSEGGLVGTAPTNTFDEDREGSRALYRRQFGAVTEVIRTAVRIPQDRTLSPERMQAACAYGLEEIFGTR